MDRLVQTVPMNQPLLCFQPPLDLKVRSVPNHLQNLLPQHFPQGHSAPKDHSVHWDRLVLPSLLLLHPPLLQ